MSIIFTPHLFCFPHPIFFFLLFSFSFNIPVFPYGVGWFFILFVAYMSPPHLLVRVLCFSLNPSFLSFTSSYITCIRLQTENYIKSFNVLFLLQRGRKVWQRRYGQPCTLTVASPNRRSCWHECTWAGWFIPSGRRLAHCWWGGGEGKSILVRGSSCHIEHRLVSFTSLDP